MKKITSLLIILSYFSFGNAQQTKDTTFLNNEFILNGEMRTRFEYRNGAFRPLFKKEKPALLFLNRVRINLNYNYKDRLKTKFSIQNAIIWGQTSPTQGNNISANTLSLFEAWADIRVYKNIWLKIGHQPINLDDGRLFSASNWTNNGRAHDALNLHLEYKKIKGKFFFAYNQNYAKFYQNNPNNPSGNLYSIPGAQNYKMMQTLWLNYQLDKDAYINLLFTNLGYQNADSINTKNIINRLQTFGLYYHFDYQKVHGVITGYYQTGYALTNRYTNAFVVAAAIGSSFNKKFYYTLGFDYTSGDKYGTHSTQNHSFKHLFGTGHKFNGNMDYFFAGNSFAHVGLMDAFLHLSYYPWEKTAIELIGHAFISPNKFTIGSEVYNKNLGQEIDVKVTIQINPFVDLSMGYSTFFTTPSLRLLKYVAGATGYQDWAWISITIHPHFFSYKF